MGPRRPGMQCPGWGRDFSSMMEEDEEDEDFGEGAGS